MTFEIALVLGILALSLILFVSEVIRMDLVALLVLSALAVTGLVSTSEAFAGFSNSAVITVWAMFILSEGLTRTGIADIIGRQVMRLAGRREIAMIVVIMITAAVLSASCFTLLLVAGVRWFYLAGLAAAGTSAPGDCS